MRAELVYRSRRNEVVHSLSAYPDLCLCIIASPAREDGTRYLRSVELRSKPIPAITTRMFKEAPLGYVCQREAMLLPREANIRLLIHPLLLEPFPEELCVVDERVYLRRQAGGRMFLYHCTMKEVDGLNFPVIEEYTREVNSEKEEYKMKKISLYENQA